MPQRVRACRRRFRDCAAKMGFTAHVRISANEEGVNLWTSIVSESVKCGAAASRESALARAKAATIVPCRTKVEQGS
jgi:hypothetical protein